MKKRIVIGAAVLVLGAACLSVPFIPTKARTVEFEVEAQDKEVEKEEEVSVKVTVAGNADMKEVEAYIYYDDSILSFEGADGDAITGTSGLLKLTDEFSEDTKESVYVLHFKALQVGKSSIAVDDAFVELKENEEVTSLQKTKASVTVLENEAKNEDASLESLDIFPGTLSREFAKDVYEYEVDVEKSVNDLVISAVANNSDSTVTVEGNENFSEGKNEVKITVTSVSGVNKEYKIIVNK